MFCLVLSSLSSVSVFAETNDFTGLENDYITELDEEANRLNFFPFEEIQKLYNRKYYLYYTAYDLKSGSGNYQTLACLVSYDKDDLNVTEDNGIYTISFGSGSTCSIIRRGQDNSTSGTSFNHATEITCDYRKSIVYDSNTNMLYYDDDKPFYYGLAGDFTFGMIRTNMFEDASKSMPDLTVEFTPNLSGEVDRTVITSSGSKSLLSELKMKVTNNSPYPVQYRMTIMLKNQVTSRLNSNFDSTDKKGYYETRYDDDPVFIYYCNDIVYDLVAEEGKEVLNSQPFKYNKPTDWHYLQPKEFDDVTFDFSMINLSENVEYVCKVVAYRCDYDLASTMLYTPANNDGFPAEPRFKQVDTTYFSVAYESTFKMLQYSDIKYDPTKKTGAVLPYDGSKGISSQMQYDYTYDAKTDLITGEQKIEHKDLYNDPNSWINKNFSYDVPDFDYSSGFGVTSFTSLTGTIRSFFGFLSTTLSYFPSNIYSVISFALTSFLILAIIRRVR